MTYISGPMTGLENYNYRSFFSAEKLLQVRGEHVINPASFGVVSTYTHADYMRRSFYALLLCDKIYMLNDWRNSLGARAEWQLAASLGMKIEYQEYEE